MRTQKDHRGVPWGSQMSLPGPDLCRPLLTPALFSPHHQPSPGWWQHMATPCRAEANQRPSWLRSHMLRVWFPATKTQTLLWLPMAFWPRANLPSWAWSSQTSVLCPCLRLLALQPSTAPWGLPKSSAPPVLNIWERMADGGWIESWLLRKFLITVSWSSQLIVKGKEASYWVPEWGGPSHTVLDKKSQ